MSAHNMMATDKMSCPDCGNDEFYVTSGNTHRVECKECSFSRHIQIFDGWE